MPQQTATTASGIHGEKPYQQHARQALPLLVRQSLTQQSIRYKDLAAELGMPNARNLNYVLGSIGTSLQDLSQQWDEAIPPIQCLVTNKSTGLPGQGFDTFLTKGVSTSKLSTREKRRLVKAAAAQVYSYTKWYDVLEAFGLPPAKSSVESQIEATAKQKGGGEGERHRRLKEAIAADPSIVDLPASLKPGQTEFGLPSGDSLDVLFQSKSRWIAIEVKTCDAPETDLIRGLFQCVKYLAVLEAWLGVIGKMTDVQVILALEGQLPTQLISLRNSLDVDLSEDVSDRWSWK